MTKSLTFELTPLAKIQEGIWKIVLTGGPCSGKTTAMAKLIEALRDRGWSVVFTSESATKLILSGICPSEIAVEDFQKQVLFDSLMQEEAALVAARNRRQKGEKVVILCDRGAMDGEAYAGPDAFQQIIAGMGLDHNFLCNNRYHGVVHMVTAANGAEEFYTLANNEARKESAEEARAIDQRTLQAWQRHHHIRVVDNSTGFDEKIIRLIAEVCSILGDPEPIEIESRFLLESFVPEMVPGHVTSSYMEQDYLVSREKGEIRRVRSRRDEHGVTYFYTTKKAISPGVRREIEIIVSEDQYLELLKDRDGGHVTIKKHRHCFFHVNQFIEVDVFEELHHESGRPLVIMEIEQSGIARQLVLPPFVNVLDDITTNAKYSNYNLSKVY